MISDATKIVSVVHVSNSLGTINPVDEIIKKAKQHNALSLLDGAQAVPHMRVDVQALDCDFYAFSGHKMFGPTGTGILYGKRSQLEALPPYMGGGDMIKTVSFEKTVYNELPHKFEAGTPNIAGGIALGTAAEYMMGLDWNIIHEHEQELLHYATSKLRNIPGIRIIGEAENKASVVSFLVDGTHPYDLGMILDKLGIAVRTGHHCTQPLMDLFQIPGTCRASFCFYNTKEDVDVLMSGIERAVAMLV
jgi:cysteine desulfurase/selenocysteine lyase